MYELKISQAWNSPFARTLPSENLTATEVKRIAEREAVFDLIKAEIKNTQHWIKINNGIFKGTIFQATSRPSSRGDNFHPCVNVDVVTRSGDNGYSAYQCSPKNIRDRDPVWVQRYASLSFGAGNLPVKFGTGEVLYPLHLSSDVMHNCSLLIGYEDGPVFCMDNKKRPETFTDRLGQEVKVGDLVVVAYNYGAGLDICIVRGYTDETRVLIESVETGEYERIPLDDNQTNKIMRLPNKLEDVAMMMKLARR